MANIIVAVIFNLVAALILVGCVISTVRGGMSVAIIKLISVLGCSVAGYFVTPIVAKKLVAVSITEELTIGLALEKLSISIATLRSIIFFGIFMSIYALALVVCSIVRHCKIKALRSKKQNTAKMKRARSINPRAVKAAKRAEWKALKAEYSHRNTTSKRILSGFMGFVVGIVVGFIALMPLSFIAKDRAAANPKAAYLAAGVEKTLNGLVSEKITDWVLHID